MTLLAYLRDERKGDMVLALADRRFVFGNREWKVEPHSNVWDIRLFAVTKVRNRRCLTSELAWVLFRSWEKKQEYAFSQIRVELMSRPKKERHPRKYEKGDYLRMEAIRKNLSDEGREAVSLMTPCEQWEYYHSHPDWEKLKTDHDAR